MSSICFDHLNDFACFMAGFMGGNYVIQSSHSAEVTAGTTTIGINLEPAGDQFIPKFTLACHDVKTESDISEAERTLYRFRLLIQFLNSPIVYTTGETA